VVSRGHIPTVDQLVEVIDHEMRQPTSRVGATARRCVPEK
jgi:hypothetical protein